MNNIPGKYLNIVSHGRPVICLIMTQNRFLVELEKKTCLIIYNGSLKKLFSPDIYKTFRNFYSMINQLYKIHQASLKPYSPPKDIQDLINWFVQNKVLDTTATAYPEFNSINQDLKTIQDYQISLNQVLKTFRD